jgi:acetyl esterase/lipase
MKRTFFLLGVTFLCAALASCSWARETKSEVPTTYRTASDVAYYGTEAGNLDEYQAQRCKLDLYYPANKSNFPTLVWFHGGGLRGGNRSVPKQLKDRGIAVAAVNYRLYPKVSCPAYIEDAAAAVAWVFKNISKYGGSADLIFVSGHSAGGYLTSMVGLDKRWLARHEIDANKIAGLIPFSGHTITHFTVREERGIPGEQPIIDEFAPLFHVRSDAPPLVLITGDRELEMLGRYEENAYLMRMMKVAGHQETTLYELQGFNHGGMAEPAFPLLLKHMAKRMSVFQKKQSKVRTVTAALASLRAAHALRYARLWRLSPCVPRARQGLAHPPSPRLRFTPP